METFCAYVAPSFLTVARWESSGGCWRVVGGPRWYAGLERANGFLFGHDSRNQSSSLDFLVSVLDQLS